MNRLIKKLYYLPILFILVISLEACGLTQKDSIDRLETEKIESASVVDLLIYKDIYPISGNIKVADGIVSGIYLDKDISVPFDWSMENIQDRAFPYRMQGFIFVAELLNAYHETGEEIYREKVVEYTLDWLEYYDEHGGVEEGWVYHDDATARRTYYQSIIFHEFGEDFTLEQKKLFKNSLEKWAALLADESFYKYNHNHGMYQDQALTMYALIVEPENAKEYLNLAATRSDKYFDFVIGEDGVHKEHSPTYHYDIATSMEWFRIAYSNVLPEFSDKMQMLLDEMAEYATYIIKPNGELPSIGDSTGTQKWSEVWSENPRYLYAYSKGEKGIMPQETMKVFADSGYGIMRSSWGDSEKNATWMILTAATHSGAHKHNDDLNFLLYYGGDVFVEAGNRNYNYLEPETMYCYSANAHNVLFVDDISFKLKENGLPFLEEVAYNTRITESSSNAATKWVKGEQSRLVDIQQTRTLAYNEDTNQVWVEDIITANKSFNGTLIYHLSWDINVQERENGWRLQRDNKDIAVVSVVSDKDVQLSMVDRGEENKYKTMIYNGRNEGKEGTTLVVDAPCDVGENKVTLNIQLLPMGSDSLSGFVTQEQEIEKYIKELALTTNDIHIEGKDNKYTFTNTFTTSQVIKYAWYVIDKDDSVIYKRGYESDNTFEYDFDQKGIYKVKAFIKNEDGEKQTAVTEAITVE